MSSNHNKHRKVVNPIDTKSLNDENVNSNVNEELERQIELELCWCIEQLQKGLKSGKLNKKQVQDHSKALNTLMSTNAPLPQKRQIMRLSFGDYRAKMTAEEKKFSGKMSTKIETPKPNLKSAFVKKSALLRATKSDFKFNFDISNPDDKSEIENPQSVHKKSNFKFIPTDNSFNFSFNID